MISPEGAATNAPEVDIWIARDGKEIGAYRRSALTTLARSGELLPTDSYWHDGMTDWQPLESLLGAEVWIKPVQPSATTRWKPILESALQPQFQKIAGVVALALLVGIVIYFLVAKHSRNTQEKLAQAVAAQGATRASRDDRLRDQAAAELRARIDKLPAVPTASSNVFYYGFRVAMQATASPGTPFVVTIRGGEDVLDPVTRQTAWRSDFTLETAYRDREWTFERYHAKTTNVKDGTTQEIDTEAAAGTPPTIAYSLGLKIPGPPQTPPPLLNIQAR